MTAYPDTRAVAREAGRDRIVVGGVDVTNFRGYTTPFPRFTLTEPFAYGATSIQFPQIHAGYEAQGFGQPGDLRWVKQGAPVTISRVFAGGSEVVDYRGVVISIDPAGRVLNLDIGGQFSGRANLLQQVTQMFRYTSDVGLWAARLTDTVHLPLAPPRGPVTGIEITHVGGQSHFSWAQYVCAMSQDEDGIQRSLMPETWGSRTWRFDPKDYTTVHATAFHADARVVLEVTDDASEQPNVIYGTGVGPDGTRYTNAKWPNVFSGPAPDYPIAGGTPFGVGTTNADTVNGDGITVLHIKLREMGYLADTVQDTGIYTTAMSGAVKKLQRKAGLSQTGTMTVAGWDALYDVDVTGYSISGAYIEPLAEDDRVRIWDRSSNGAILRRNPLYDATVLRVEVFKDYGAGLTKGAMMRHARGILVRSNSAKNWVGTLRFNNAGLFTGDQSAADRALLTDADLMPMRDLRPGMNVMVPDFDGGTLFHVAGCEDDADGVTATIDTQARDLVEVREILARNAESRRDIRREWNAANRPAKHSTALISSDENFGELDRNVRLVGNAWNVIPVIVGQHGQVNRVDLRLINDKAEFAYAILTKPMTPGGKGGVSARLKRRFGNPLVVADESWLEKDALADWYDDRTVLVAEGSGKQPCGYGPSRRKFNDVGDRTSAVITGRHISDENFAYICAPHTNVIAYLAIYPDRDCTLNRGKVLYCQLDDAV